jgi:hypothetical protein
LGGGGGDDFGRAEPADIDGESEKAAATGVLVDDVWIDVAADVAEVADVTVSELDGVVAMDEDRFTIEHHANRVVGGNSKSGFSGKLALTFKSLAMAALRTGPSQDAFLVVVASGAGISEHARRDPSGLIHAINRDKLGHGGVLNGWKVVVGDRKLLLAESWCWLKVVVG